ncbi:hypothetical protein YC2023_036832 [Brassica napus]
MTNTKQYDTNGVGCNGDAKLGCARMLEDDEKLISRECQHYISPHNPYLNGPTLLEKSHKCYNETLAFDPHILYFLYVSLQPTDALHLLSKQSRENKIMSSRPAKVWNTKTLQSDRQPKFSLKKQGKTPCKPLIGKGVGIVIVNRAKDVISPKKYSVNIWCNERIAHGIAGK